MAFTEGECWGLTGDRTQLSNERLLMPVNGLTQLPKLSHRIVHNLNDKTTNEERNTF